MTAIVIFHNLNSLLNLCPGNYSDSLHQDLGWVRSCTTFKPNLLPTIGGNGLCKNDYNDVLLAISLASRNSEVAYGQKNKK